MGFMDELRKLTQPYEDEDDFYEGADPAAQQAAPTEAQLEFENAFGGHDSQERAEDEEVEETNPAPQESGKGIFSALGRKKPARPRLATRERTVEFGGTEQQVILFNPKSFDEAGDLVQHLSQGRSFNRQIVELEMQARLTDYLRDHLEIAFNDFVTIPSNIGVNDAAINSAIVIAGTAAIEICTQFVKDEAK